MPHRPPCSCRAPQPASSPAANRAPWSRPFQAWASLVTLRRVVTHEDRNAYFLGGPTTIQFPFTVPVPVTITQPTQTLFAPCPETSTTTIFSSTTSFSISQSTPPPVVITSETPYTRADGSIIIHWQTITSTLPATPVYVPTVVPVSQQNINSNARPVNLGPVIGGVVGGFFGLIGIVAVLWFFLSVLLPFLCFNMLNTRLTFFRRKRPSWGDIFEAEDSYIPTPIRSARDKKRRVEFDMDVQPKPYQYGLVGQVQTTTLSSPPGSPTSTSPPLSSHPPSWHGRQRSSLTPLLLPSSASTPGNSMPTTASSRPSTAGSMYPVRPPSQHASATRPATEEFGTRPMSYPSQSQNANWRRASHPTPVTGWNAMDDRPYSTISDGPNRRGSPVSFQEPRRPLHIVNAPLSTISLDSTAPDSPLQQNEAGSPQLPSPLGPNSGGPPRMSVLHDNVRHGEPEVVVTAPSAPPSYEA